MLARTALLLALLAPAPAAAQGSSIARARQQMERAEFDAAVATLDTAETSSSGLSRAEVVDLYATRAAAHLALGHTAEMERDLDRLAALDPTYTFDEAARPELAEGIAERRGAPLSIDVEISDEPGGARVRAAVHRDPGDLVRSIHLRARPAGATAWIEASGETLVVPGADEVEVWADAIGPGGATLASAGSEDAPIRGRGEVPLADPATSGGEAATGGPDWLGIGLGIGGGVLAAIVVVIVVSVAASSPSNVTQPGPPRIFELGFD
jgi:hypothetical protein